VISFQFEDLVHKEPFFTGACSGQEIAAQRHHGFVNPAILARILDPEVLVSVNAHRSPTNQFAAEFCGAFP